MAMTSEELALVTEASTGVKTLSDKFQKLAGRLSNVNFILTVLVLALFVGFAGMFVATGTLMYDAYTNKAATYLELSNKVQEQNVKIDALTTKLATTSPVNK